MDLPRVYHKYSPRLDLFRPVISPWRFLGAGRGRKWRCGERWRGLRGNGTLPSSILYVPIPFFFWTLTTPPMRSASALVQILSMSVCWFQKVQSTSVLEHFGGEVRGRAGRRHWVNCAPPLLACCISVNSRSKFVVNYTMRPFKRIPDFWRTKMREATRLWTKTFPASKPIQSTLVPGVLQNGRIV